MLQHRLTGERRRLGENGCRRRTLGQQPFDQQSPGRVRQRAEQRVQSAGCRAAHAITVECNASNHNETNLTCHHASTELDIVAFAPTSCSVTFKRDPPVANSTISSCTYDLDDGSSRSHQTKSTLRRSLM